MTSVYRLFASSILTRGRMALFAALAAVALIVAYAIDANEAADPIDDGTVMIAALGLSLVAPVVALVLASSVLGDPHEDGTLVYLWLRPVPRWQIAVSAWAASISVALPVVVVPMALAATIVGSGTDLPGAAIAASTVATLAYTGIFTFLGLRVRRAMPWGLAYILIWEGFVAGAGAGAEFLSVRSHTTSLLTRLADGPVRLESSSTTTAVVVPLVAAVLATVLTVRRLQRQDVQ